MTFRIAQTPHSSSSLQTKQGGFTHGRRVRDTFETMSPAGPARVATSALQRGLVRTRGHNPAHLLEVSPSDALRPQVVVQAMEAAVQTHGAVLLRGLHFDNTEAINAFLIAGGYQLFEYDGIIVKLPRLGGAKTVVADGRALGLHTECSFLAKPPARIGFYCFEAAPVGGASVIGRVARFVRALGDDVLQEFAARDGVLTHRWFPARHRLDQARCVVKAANVAWEDWVESTNRDVAEQHFRAQGFDVYWDDDGGLHIVRKAPAVVADPHTGEPLWHCFAQSRGLPPVFEVKFGDGTPISDALHTRIDTVLNNVSETVPLQRHELLMLDNQRMMHGREAFEGPRALVQVMANLF